MGRRGTSDRHRCFNPLKTSGAYNCQFLSRIDAKLCLSFAYDCNISRRWTAMMVNNSIIALGAVHERDICLKGDELI